MQTPLLKHLLFLDLCPRHNTPSSDLVVSVTSEQSLSISAPGQRNTFRLTALLALLDIFGLELVNLALLLKIEDGDTRAGGSAQPIAVRRKNECMDLIAGMKRVKVLGLVKIPEHGNAILTTGRAERAIRGDGDSVDVAGVTDVVGLQAAGSEFPDLQKRVSLAWPFSTTRLYGNKRKQGNGTSDMW